MSWNRGQRLEALLKEKVATIIVEKLSDPRIGFTTITRVELSRDKKHARVYYTALGEAEQLRTTRRGLEAAAPHIQEALAPHFKARNLPELRFVYDESVQREANMLQRLDELAEQRRLDELARTGGDPAAPDADPEATDPQGADAGDGVDAARDDGSPTDRPLAD